MKRKLALMLAVVMLLGAAIPMNLMAYANTRTRLAQETPITNLFGVRNVIVDASLNAKDDTQFDGANVGKITPYGSSSGNNAILSNNGKGLDLIVQVLSGDIPEDGRMQITLSNAIYAFYKNDSVASIYNTNYTQPLMPTQTYSNRLTTEGEDGYVRILSTNQVEIGKHYQSGDVQGDSTYEWGTENENDMLRVGNDVQWVIPTVKAGVLAGFGVFNTTLAGLTAGSTTTAKDLADAMLGAVGPVVKDYWENLQVVKDRNALQQTASGKNTIELVTAKEIEWMTVVAQNVLKAQFAEVKFGRNVPYGTTGQIAAHQGVTWNDFAADDDYLLTNAYANPAGKPALPGLDKLEALGSEYHYQYIQNWVMFDIGSTPVYPIGALEYIPYSLVDAYDAIFTGYDGTLGSVPNLVASLGQVPGVGTVGQLDEGYYNLNTVLGYYNGMGGSQNGVWSSKGFRRGTQGFELYAIGNQWPLVPPVASPAEAWSSYPATTGELDVNAPGDAVSSTVTDDKDAMKVLLTQLTRAVRAANELKRSSVYTTGTPAGMPGAAALATAVAADYKRYTDAYAAWELNTTGVHNEIINYDFTNTTEQRLFKFRFSDANYSEDAFYLPGDEIAGAVTPGGKVPAAHEDGDYYDEGDPVAQRMGGTTYPNAKAVAYTLQVSQYNYSEATIILDEPAQAGDIIIIPMVMMPTNGEPITAYVDGGSMFTNPGEYVQLTVGSALAYGQTKSEFTGVVNAARSRVYLSSLKISENNPNVLKNGTFVLIPPAGYNMIATRTNTNRTAADALIPAATTSTNLGSVTVATGGIVSLGITDQYGENPRKALAITLAGLAAEPRSFPGYLQLEGLALESISNDPYLVTNMGADLEVQIKSWSVASGQFLASYLPTGQNGRYVWSADGSYMIFVPGTDALTSGYNTYDPADAAKLVSTDSAGVTNQTLKGAVRQQWSIKYDAAEAVQRYSGLKNQPAALITVEELTRDSWMARKETIFTLTDAEGNPLEDVRISKVAVRADNLNGIKNGTNFVDNRTDSTLPPKEYLNADMKGDLSGMPIEYSYVSFPKAGNEFRVTDVYTTEGQQAKMTLQFYLSASANFSDDVYVKISGNAISDNTYNELNQTIVPVASFAPPVLIDTTSTNIQIGYQSYKVSKVTITENFTHANGSAIKAGQKIQLALGEYGKGKLTNYMYFAPISKSDITLSNDSMFMISDVATINVSGFGNNWNQRVIEFGVTRKSNAGAVMTIDNLNLNISRDVPEGSYDFLVGGPALVDNFLAPNQTYLYQYDRFDVFGVTAPGYVTVGTPGAYRPVTNRVEIEMSHGIYDIKVNGETVTLTAPLNVSEEGRMYVPLRFISEHLGIPEENIVWDDGSRKVLIRTEEYSVVFQQDSPWYNMAGAEFKMTDPETGAEMTAWIDPALGRMYVPYYFLAKALGIEYFYDEATNTVIYNYDTVAEAAEVVAE
jgi:hypothetical protein